MSGAIDSFDLSGEWQGTYAYPDGQGPMTPFVAVLSETSGTFSGTILEPDLYQGFAQSVEASLAGHRSGRSVDFTKTYRGQQQGYENPVDYVGQLSPDGQLITGVWSLGGMNGRFEMTRETMLSDPVSEAVEASVGSAGS